MFASRCGWVTPIAVRADKTGVFRIGSNYASGPGLLALKSASRAIATSAERLATGKRINRAADDPAGAVAVDELRTQEVVVRRKIDAVGRESARLGATEGALSVVQDLAIELRGHVVASANRGAMTKDELAAHQQSVDSILETIDFLSQTTTHEGSQIIAGYSSARLGQAGSVLSMLGSGGGLNLVDGELEEAGRVAEAAVAVLSGSRGAIGARMNEMDHQHSLLVKELEGLAGARSKIEDADVASEAAALARARALQEVAAYTSSLTSRMEAGQVLTLLAGVATL